MFLQTDQVREVGKAKLPFQLIGKNAQYTIRHHVTIVAISVAALRSMAFSSCFDNTPPHPHGMR